MIYPVSNFMHDRSLHPFGVCTLQELYLVATWNVKAYKKFASNKHISDQAVNIPDHTDGMKYHLRCECAWNETRVPNTPSNIRCVSPSVYVTDTHNVGTYGKELNRGVHAKHQYEQFDLDAGVEIFYVSATSYGYDVNTIKRFLDNLSEVGGAFNMDKVDFPRLVRWKNDPFSLEYDGIS